jgi:phosphoglucosamine mutase
MLTRSLRAALGVMISASHNSFEDNGIKLFGPDGYKLSDDTEAEIERMVEAGVGNSLVNAAKIGRAKRLEDASGRYIEFAKRTLPRGMRLDGLKIVIDCAHGAAYNVAPAALWELGADVIPIGVQPDGFNINKGCGSTATDLMCRTVVEEGADLGIALDGDADRVMISDENGKLLDGDQLMALIADSWRRAGRLRGGGIVGTVMSNLGLEHFLREIGLSLIRTQVGDRYVVEHMRAHDFNIGGEQSGHIILHDYNSTGDGLIAALEVLTSIVSADKPASEVGNIFQPLPQLLRNVRFSGVMPLELDPVKKAIRAGEERLGNTGRLLIRKSGTEPLIRVMAEGDDETLIAEVVGNICDAVEQAVQHAAA